MGKSQIPWDFRDVYKGLAKMREFLLGRKNVNPHRFPPLLSPRSIPPPDVPRGPEYKYSDQYYGSRNALNSVKPPVVAPVAIEASTRRFPCWSRKQLKFPSELPTPGCVWWFDAHCYYKEEFQTPCGPTPPTVPGPLKANAPCPCPEPKSPSAPPKEETVCKIDPCQTPDVTPKLTTDACEYKMDSDEKKK